MNSELFRRLVLLRKRVCYDLASSFFLLLFTLCPVLILLGLEYLPLFLFYSAVSHLPSAWFRASYFLP